MVACVSEFVNYHWAAFMLGDVRGAGLTVSPVSGRRDAPPDTVIHWILHIFLLIDWPIRQFLRRMLHALSFY